MTNFVRATLLATCALLTPTASMARDVDPLILHMTDAAVAGRVEPEEFDSWVAQIDRIVRQHGITRYDIRALREMAEGVGHARATYRPGFMKIMTTLLAADNRSDGSRRIPDDLRRLCQTAALRLLDAGDADSRHGALVMLREIADDDIAAPVIAMLKDSDDPVRLEALMILRDLSRGESRAVIASAVAPLATDPKPRIREAAMVVIEQAKD